MTRDEFIEELKKLLPSYLKLDVPTLSVFLNDTDDIINLVFNVETYNDTVDFHGYKYAPENGTFYWTNCFDSTFDRALSYFKTVSLDSIAKLKNVVDNYDLEAIDSTLTGLGFAKQDDNSYEYELDDLKLRIETLDLDDLTIAPFLLAVYRRDTPRYSDYFSSLDALLNYIVSGGN